MENKFDLIVLGGGSAGLTGALFAKNLGAKVLLIEKNRIGGDCLWTGCVPSKTLLSIAKEVHSAKHCEFLSENSVAEIDTVKILKQLDLVRERIKNDKDNADRLEREGVLVCFGEPTLLSQNRVTVNGAEYFGKKFLLATGSRPNRLRITGLPEEAVLTTDEIFNVSEIPSSLTIVGGGPVGCELAFAFTRLGVKVSLLHSGDRLLAREPKSASEFTLNLLTENGVKVYLGCEILKGEVVAGVKSVTFIDSTGEQKTIDSEMLLGAVGRTANFDIEGAEKIGLKVNKSGFVVDEFLRATLDNFYVAGDVSGGRQFTHFASAQAGLCVRNMFLPFKAKATKLTVPRVTYLDPEIASVGLLPVDLLERKIKFRTFTASLGSVDRANTENKTEGFAEIYTNTSGIILGACLVCPTAGEMISELTLAVKNKSNIRNLSEIIRPYPTYGELISATALNSQRERLTPFVKRVLRLINSFE